MAKKQGGKITFVQKGQGKLWASVPELLAKDTRISGNALRVYCALCIKGVEAGLQGGTGYEGQEKLGKDFGGMSGDAVHRALTQLVKAGYIETERVGLGHPDNVRIKRLP